MTQKDSRLAQNNGLITGMGAALVDLFAAVSEDELTALGSPKASMSLIDAAQSTALQENVSIDTRQPGGSIANSIAGMAALGMATGFIGKSAMMIWAASLPMLLPKGMCAFLPPQWTRRRPVIL